MMPLPVHYAQLDEITLDNLKFQDLVDEGRKRIRQYCPDWTEYNVSDPGVTLIELFAWMTESILYRLNQVPRKHYIKFLEMLGYGLQPATPATAELAFRLAAPFPVDPVQQLRQPSEFSTRVAQGFQVSTGQSNNEMVVFTVDRTLEIRTPVIAHLRDSRHFGQNFWTLTPTTGKLQASFSVFHDKPQQDDAFYIGFGELNPLLSQTPTTVATAPQANAPAISRLSGHILRLTIDCQQEPPPPPPAPVATPPTGDTTNPTTLIPVSPPPPQQTAGHRLNQPPLLWEYCTEDLTAPQASNTAWKLLETGKEGADRDSTGGLYYPTGNLTLLLPLEIRPHRLDGYTAVWVRCRYRPGLYSSDNQYSKSPVLERILVQTLGAVVKATNTTIVKPPPPHQRLPQANGKSQDHRTHAEDLAKALGVSNGEPGQMFSLPHFPLLIPNDNERIFVESEPRSNRFEPWEYVETFAESHKYANHVLLNRNQGELHFGPNIRQPDGTVKQYGRVPPVGCRVFIQGYRYHAGASGNVPAHHLQVMHQSAPYVDHVTNPKPAQHGRDAETVEEAIMRAQRLLRAQERAVSARDFEILTPRHLLDDRQPVPTEVAILRVKCLTPDDFLAAATAPPATTPSATTSPASNVTRSGPVAAGTVDLLLVPAVKHPANIASWPELELSPTMCEAVRQHLQPFCLIARSVRVRKPVYQAIKVSVTVKTYWAKDAGRATILQQRIERFLYRYLSPLPYGSNAQEAESHQIDNLPAVVRNERWDGWEFGERLQELRLRALLQEIEGVKYVDSLNVQVADLRSLDVSKLAGVPAEQHAAKLKQQISLQPFDFNQQPEPDVLYCSLEHSVVVV